jgi:TolA-binding protein
MSDPKSLEALAAALFDAGREERGPAAARTRMLDALLATLLDREAAQLAAPAQQSNVVPIDVREQAGAPAGRPNARRPQPWARIGLGLLAAAAVCVLALLAHDAARRSPTIAPALDALRVQPSSPSARPASDAERATRVSDALLERAAPKAPQKPRSQTQRPPATLTEEVAALDAARSALSAGDAKRALAQLDRYDSQLHGARLHAEALLLRSEALAADGRKPAAAALAREFLAKYPNSTLADRARALARGDAP